MNMKLTLLLLGYLSVPYHANSTKSHVLSWEHSQHLCRWVLKRQEMCPSSGKGVVTAARCLLSRFPRARGTVVSCAVASWTAFSLLRSPSHPQGSLFPSAAGAP